MSIVPQTGMAARSRWVRNARLVAIVVGCLAIVAGIALHRLPISYFGALALTVAMLSGGGC